MRIARIKRLLAEAASVRNFSRTASVVIGISCRPRTQPGRGFAAGLFGMICLGCASPALIGYARFFLFVAALCYIVTVLLCIIYVLGVNTALSALPWLLGELAYTVTAVVLYIIASVTQLVSQSSYYETWPTMFSALNGQYIAAGVFGLLQAIVYGAGAFLLFQDWKATRPPPPPPQPPRPTN
ncbi:hypothetical protein HPB52_003916 [Rhipicephalus sanguineus]|uniref:MARVEL domain-containing protein n=1 Tax=Rhipicephalus sanguineus TaxID=34632 RepID=A0A9D4T7G7_RHISA|nr:hypothetical protein HPB52_003916 [Rhipicephalus sanguineus]